MYDKLKVSVGTALGFALATATTITSPLVTGLLKEIVMLVELQQFNDPLFCWIRPAEACTGIGCKMNRKLSPRIISDARTTFRLVVRK